MIFSILLFLFIAMPIAEIALLLRVGEWIGGSETIALVIGTGVVGAWLARQQGAQVLRRMQRDLQTGETPAPLLIDGFLIFVAGLLLITPGIITDVVGFLLLVPLTRREIRVWIRRWLEKKMKDGSVNVRIGGPFE